MEFCHQWLWPQLDVQFSSVTEQWAQFSVAGPRSRDVLRKLVDGQLRHLQRGAFRIMAAAEVTVMGGVPARLFRISFSGELAYEIAVPAGYGDALIRRLMEAGREFGIAPYGTEALGVHAHREGPRRRQRDQRPDHRARSGARPHDVEPRRTTSAG